MTMPVSSTGAPRPATGVNGGRKAYFNQLSDGAKGYNFASIRPKSKPVNMTIGSGGIPAAASAAAAQIDTLTFADNPIVWEYYQNTAQTLMPRLVASSEANGLEIGGDLVDNETVEHVIGGNHLANPYAYTVGTSKPARFLMTLTLADGSGTDNFGIGWRKVQAYAAATAPIFLAATDPTYTDFVFFGVAAAAADAPALHVISDLNDSATPVDFDTTFTWADTKTHSLEIRLYGSHPQYFINGVRLGSGPITLDGLGAALTAQTPLRPAAYTFDTGDVLVPFFFNRMATTSPGTIYVSALGTLPGVQVGPLSELGLDDNNLQY